MSEKTYTSNIPAITPIETLPKQFVLDRTDMSTSFSDSEYQACLNAITAGQVVAVNWIQGGATRQLQLVSVSVTGILKFSYARGYDLETWTVAASSSHSITHELYDVNPTGFAPTEYGTNEVHNLPTTIASFRTGDVIAVDGPDGTAKMSKDDLLKETAKNALNSIHLLSDAATESDLVSGNYLALDSSAGTKKLPANCVAKRSVQDNILSRISEVSNIAWEGSFVVPAGSTSRGFNVTSGFLFPSGKRLVMCCSENCKSVQMWTSSWGNALYTTTAGNAKTMTPVADAEIMNLVFKNESASDVTEYVKFVYYDDVTIIGNAAKIRLMDTRVGNIETKNTQQDSDISNLQADVLKLDTTTSENSNFIKERTNVLINQSMMVSGKGVKTWESMSNIKMNDPSTYLYNDATNVISEIVPVKQGDILKLVWYDAIVATSFKYLLFDSNGDGYEFGTSSGAYRTKTIAIDGFIMFYAANAANFPPCVAVVSDDEEWVDARTPLYWDKHDKNPYPPNENPLEIIRSDAGYFPVFRSMGIVGDSLSCGAVEGTLDGNFVCPEFKDNSSAAVIERITGVPATYFAKGGAYLHDNNWQNQFAAAVASNPCDMYIIAIGYNDQGWVRDENKLGTIADINDADPSQNADSFYGYYGKMVQTILNAQPRAKLFFVTCPFYEWSVQSWNISINNAIREMCTKYNGFLIDLATYYLFPFYGVPDVRRSGELHLNTIGYYEVGIVMLSYINYIIRHNKEKFVDVSLIGTDIVIAPLVD